MDRVHGSSDDQEPSTVNQGSKNPWSCGAAGLTNGQAGQLLSLSPYFGNLYLERISLNHMNVDSWLDCVWVSG